MAWSASRISMALSCPQAYRYKYLGKLAPIEDIGDTTNRDAGTMIHNAIASATRFCLGSNISSDTILAHIDPEERGRVVKRAKKIINETETLSLPRCQDRWVERKFELNMFGHDVTGFWDRVDVYHGSRVDVIDYKTGSKNYLPKADSPQAMIYAEAAMRETGKKDVTVTFLHLPSKEEVVYRHHSSDKLKHLLNTATRFADCGDANAKPSVCGRCAYRLICPDARDLYQGEGIAPGLAGMSNDELRKAQRGYKALHKSATSLLRSRRPK